MSPRPSSHHRAAGHRHLVLVVAICTTLLALEVALDCHSTVRALQVNAPFLPSALYGLAVWWWWGMLLIVVWDALKRWPRMLLPVTHRQLIHLPIASAVLALHGLFLKMVIAFDLHRWPGLAGADFASLHLFSLHRLGIDALLYVVLVGGCGLVHLYVDAQEDKLRSANMERELSAAQLHALQTQIDPHFLFNTLNSVSALISFDEKEQALETLSNLNALLRRTLASQSPAKVALSQEVQAAEQYLAIEQIRFQDRLEISMSVEAEALKGLVPCFILQPLLENAIQHGAGQKLADGVIEVSAAREGAFLDLHVRDNGPGQASPSHNGHGIGLKNTRERLRHLYRENYVLKAEPLTCGGFQVSILIPFEQAR